MNSMVAARLILFVYVGALLLSPPLRLSGIPGMRGFTADQFLVFIALAGFAFVGPRFFGKALRDCFRRGFFVGYLYAAVVAVAIVAVAFRIVVDSSQLEPAIELARLYGVMRPAFVIVLGVLITRLYFLEAFDKAYRDLVVCFLVIGAFPLMVGLGQGLGVPSVVDFSANYYSRGSNFDVVLMYGRAYGTFDGQPNVFGTFCAIYILFLINYLRFSWRLVALVPLLGLAVLCLIFSGSRGAMLALLIAGMAWMVVSKGFSFIVYAGFLLFVLAGVFFLFEGVLPEAQTGRLISALGLGSGGDPGLATTRLPYWSMMIDLFLQKPLRLLWGVPGYLMPPTDNLQLAWVAALGLFGALIYLYIVLRLASKFFQLRDKEGAEFGVLSLVFLLNGVSYPTFFNGRLGDFFWLAAACVVLGYVHRSDLVNADTAGFS